MSPKSYLDEILESTPGSLLVRGDVVPGNVVSKPKPKQDDNDGDQSQPRNDGNDNDRESSR